LATFGLYWVEKFLPHVHKLSAIQGFGMPSFEQLIEGLFTHSCERARENLQGFPEDQINSYIKTLRSVFDFFYSCLDVTDRQKEINEEKFELPDSKETCFILYLYTMEPSFCADLNIACKDMDKSKIETLGPYARALYVLLQTGDKFEEKRADVMKQGKVDGADGPLGYYSQSFLLFKGALMPTVD